MKAKVSFVVIAKNGVFIIDRCMKSIIDASQKLTDYEIIFIDSYSTDGTFEKVKAIQNDKVHIYRITKNANQARARNLGAKNAQYDFLFFIDGDVEIDMDFIVSAITEMQSTSNVEYVHGRLKEIQYSNGYKEILQIIADRKGIKKKSYNKGVSGGIFIVSKRGFHDVGGFNEEFDSSEDRDFMFRFRKNHKIMALPQIMGTHHTISYINIRRLSMTTRNASYKYVGYLLRKHLLSFNDVFSIMKWEKGVFFGGFVYLILLLGIILNSPLIKVFGLVLFLVDILLGIRRGISTSVGRIWQHYIFIWYICFGVLFFYPIHEKYEWSKAK